MIELTRLNGSTFMLNSDLIETVEATPDTVITLINGHRYLVKETPDQIRSLFRSSRHIASLEA